MVAGIVGRPVTHSLSPLIHNAWLAAAGIDGVYVPFTPDTFGLPRLAEGLRGGVIRGLNVTIPFKEAALAAADQASELARRAGAANVLIFDRNGKILADNTDGQGLLGAFAAQAPRWDVRNGPVTVIGAGGAARGAVAALLEAGAPKVWLLNRTLGKADAIAADLGERVAPLPLSHCASALQQTTAVINATSAGLNGEGSLDLPLELTHESTVVMDMVYKPLTTPFLAQARALGRPTVDGLEMLIQQAIPSFEHFFGQPPPLTVDTRALALEALNA